MISRTCLAHAMRRPAPRTLVRYNRNPFHTSSTGGSTSIRTSSVPCFRVLLQQHRPAADPPLHWMTRRFLASGSSGSSESEQRRQEEQVSEEEEEKKLVGKEEEEEEERVGEEEETLVDGHHFDESKNQSTPTATGATSTAASTTLSTKHCPASIRKQQTEVDLWLTEADKVPFGKRRRGHIQVKKRIEEFECARRGRPYLCPREKAAKRLYKLIFRRHALKHGFWSLKEMTNRDLGKSFGVNHRIVHKDAEFIIKQQWKFGKSEYLNVMYLGKPPEKGSKMNKALGKKIRTRHK